MVRNFSWSEKKFSFVHVLTTLFAFWFFKYNLSARGYFSVLFADSDSVFDAASFGIMIWVEIPMGTG